MKPWPRTFVALWCSIAFAGGALRAQDIPSPHAKLDVPAERLERSASGWRVPPSDDRELAGRYRVLFAGASDEQLARLAEDPESGVALQAAYELAVRAPRPSQRAAFVRLFDLARKHAGVPVPPWWQDGLAGGNLDGRRKAYPAGEGGARRIKKMPGGVRYEEGRRSVVLSLPTDQAKFSQGGELGMDSDVALTRSRAFLAAAGGSPGVLYAFEMPAARFEWQAEIWAYFRGRLSLNGWIEHSIRIVANEDRVVVFGGGTVNAYLEVFEAKSGRNVFRFCSNYWTMADEVRGNKTPPAKD